MITDVTSDAFKTPTARPPIVFVQNDADGDGPILDAAADYEDVDPATQKTLVIKVTSTAADNAVVNVGYGSNGRPDPGIRPWTGGPDWRSPDIEVRNAKSMADPGRWFNTPWIGNPNTVVAKVRNGGDLLCKGVVVDFYAIEFTTGDGPMMLLGSDTHDIAPGAVQEFTAGWTPVDSGGHYCIVVRIRLYQDPTVAGVIETNIYNNEARPNYTRFVSASASPSSRAIANIRLANPFDESTLVKAVVHQTHPYHRVYLEHQWLRVPGGASLPVQVFDEALWGFPEADGHGEMSELLWSRDNEVSVEGWAERPFAADCGAPTLTGGVGIRVGAGRATETRIEEAHFGYAGGVVRFLDGGGERPTERSSWWRRRPTTWARSTLSATASPAREPSATGGSSWSSAAHSMQSTGSCGHTSSANSAPRHRRASRCQRSPEPDKSVDLSCIGEDFMCGPMTKSLVRELFKAARRRARRLNVRWRTTLTNGHCYVSIDGNADHRRIPLRNIEDHQGAPPRCCPRRRQPPARDLRWRWRVAAETRPRSWALAPAS